ncbi:MAG: transporter [Rhodospirillales bacterium]|nr:transporter [Rhodospirillales bacterium]
MNEGPTRWQRFMSQGMGRVFRHRDFVIYSFAGFFANIGIWVQRVGVQWLAWELTHSYAWLGAIAFVDAIGVIVCMPFFGTLIDRSDRLKMMRLAQVLVTVLVVVLAVFTLMHWMTIWIVVAAMALHGVIDAFWAPARLSMSPSLVPRADLAPAIGLNASMFNLAQILGPAAAGLIIAGFDDTIFGIGMLFVITTVGYIVYLVALCIIKLRYEERRASSATSFVVDMKDGLLYIFQKPGLSLYMALMLTTTLVMRPFRELLAGFADGVFLQGPGGLAMLTSAVGVGALIGALVVANTTKVRGMTRLVMIVFGLGIVFQFAFVLAPTFNIAVGAIAFLGITVAVGGIGSQVLIQSSIHNAMRGRVLSVWSLIMRAGPPVGAWVLGGLAEFWDLQTVFVVATALYMLFFLAMITRFKMLAQNMESPPADESRDTVRRSTV